MATARTETRPDGSTVEYDAANRVVRVNPSAANQGKRMGQERRAFRDAYLDLDGQTAAQPAQPVTEARPQSDGSISGNSVARAAAVAQDPNSLYGIGIKSDRPGLTPAGFPAVKPAGVTTTPAVAPSAPAAPAATAPLPSAAMPSRAAAITAPAAVTAPPAAPAPAPAARDRQANIAQAKADGTFEQKREQFNQANAGRQRMDLDGNILPAESSAPTTPKPYELTYQKADGSFYGETRDGLGQVFATEEEAKAFSNGNAPAATTERSIDTVAAPTAVRPVESPIATGDEAKAILAAQPAVQSPIAAGQEAEDILASVRRPLPPGMRVQPSGSGFAPVGRGTPAGAPRIALSQPPKPTTAPLSRADAMTAAKNRGLRQPAASPIATGAEAEAILASQPAVTSPIQERPLPTGLSSIDEEAEPPQNPIIDAGPQPGIPDEPEDELSIDLPSLRRPAVRSRPRATIREPQL